MAVTKADLMEENKRLKAQLEELQAQYNDLNDFYGDVENELADAKLELQNQKSGINVDDFIWRMQLDNLYNDEMEKFINDYVRYYN